MSAFGDLKYPPDFRHFDYVNPAAPKGGTLNSVVSGTFDSFNPYIVQGSPAAGFQPFGGGLIYDTFSTYAWLFVGAFSLGIGAFLSALAFTRLPRRQMVAVVA